ncbi:uncharacterized protein LOC100160441 isoform X3 [Acyrthosiphon pisum]|uniref:Uncharacterized protein n=1 Tax=Acyrthosiphon pisum TaxID=7029 RepID=A0A8R1VYW9_ACYPI|nr:uncharacterized protein LOC100160441 isoform X3 [Acyrthosiphon pisum]|eukprot:XP_001944172.2 PREDICTED: uncharacterized protein LOC100160441 isoform X3 [Acyrthosiphon pisum]
MDAVDRGSDSEPIEILEHEGHAYEKKYTGNAFVVAASDWVLWKCVKSGCPGKIATTAVRTKRWRRKRFTVRRDVAGNRLTAFVPRRPHNHAPATVHGKETSKLNGMTTAIPELTPMTSPTTSHTDVLAAPSFKELNEIDAFHSSEPKSSLSPTDIENINSINLDNVPKSMENVEQTVTTFDDGIKMSNINDTAEFQAVKSVSLIDHQIHSKERHLKDISVTVNSTNIIKNIKEKNGVQIKYGSSSMSTQNKNDEILCHICSTFFDEYCYNQHIQTTRHISAYNPKKTKPLQLIRCKLCSIYVVQQNYEQHQETTAHKISLLYLKNEKVQINGVQSDNCFLSCRILSPKYVSIDDFFQSIESDVMELIARIIQLQNGGPIRVNIKMFGLYNHNSLISKPDTLGDVKSFMIRNEILSEVTILLHWIQKVLNKFKSHHQQYLKSMPQSYYLERVMFLDLCFYEMTSI